MIDPKSKVGIPSVKYGSSDTFPITTEEYNRLEADAKRYRFLKREISGSLSFNLGTLWLPDDAEKLDTTIDQLLKTP